MRSLKSGQVDFYSDLVTPLPQFSYPSGGGNCAYQIGLS